MVLAANYISYWHPKEPLLMANQKYKLTYPVIIIIVIHCHDVLDIMYNFMTVIILIL